MSSPLCSSNRRVEGWRSSGRNGVFRTGCEGNVASRSRVRSGVISLVTRFREGGTRWQRELRCLGGDEYRPPIASDESHLAITRKNSHRWKASRIVETHTLHGVRVKTVSAVFVSSLALRGRSSKTATATSDGSVVTCGQRKMLTVRNSKRKRRPAEALLVP